jgi:hypothetical protein
MERDWVRELERYLEGRFTELCRTIGQPVPGYGLRINPALGAEESKYFLLGLEAGLFQADEEGYVQSELLPPPSTGNSKQKMCQIFWHNPSPRLFREGICQLATASSLILERGWLKNQIVMEPSIEEDGAMADGVTILVKSPTDNILICVEIKRSVAELQKLITDFRACCKRGRHAQADCAFEQNHPKYEFCALYTPTYFWAVAPDADVCLTMAYNEESMEVVELGPLAQRSVIELLDCRDRPGAEG